MAICVVVRAAILLLASTRNCEPVSAEIWSELIAFNCDDDSIATSASDKAVIWLVLSVLKLFCRITENWSVVSAAIWLCDRAANWALLKALNTAVFKTLIWAWVSAEICSVLKARILLVWMLASCEELSVLICRRLKPSTCSVSKAESWLDLSDLI